jgi:UDP-N-acetyl-D-galactosamine dehydrogenase
MPAYAAKKIVQQLIKMEKDIGQTRILVMGATFKENVKDIRNSKVAELCQELEAYSATVEVIDPLASKEEMLEEYGITLIGAPTPPYDALVLATPHTEYIRMNQEEVALLLTKQGLVADLKGVWRGRMGSLPYWSL